MTKKPTVTTLQSGFNSTEVLSQNFEALRDAFDNTLSLDGSTPNAMEADLDLNGNNIIGATGLLINGTDYLAAAEAAKAAALVAQSAAELAENNAETAEVNAEASETAAANSATASASSASAASVSATAAQTAQTAAELAETNAQTAETNAETAETNAQSSALAALASEIAASTSETNAAASEAASSTSETNAAASAAAASTSETNAASSETNAAASASASASSATASAASATAASASEASVEADRLSAQAAATSASASEVAAAASESNAASSETAAASSASSASTSASNAASSASSAQASKDAALAALDSFDDRYLGQKASDPALDNDGNALVAGALYFNTTDDIMKVYEGSVWVAAYASLSGALLANNNLSDISSVTSARTNLGLGTAATTASTDYATAAQGSLADSAVQPNDSPTFAGLTTTGNVSLGDNDKAIFGAGSDFQIYHDGSNSYIDDAGTGDLYIRSGNDLLFTNADGSESYARFQENGYVRLFYDNSVKLATTSTGIDVTGTVTADGLTVDGASTGEVRIKAADNAETTFPLVIENSADSLDLGLGAYGLDNTIGVSQGSNFKMNVGGDIIMKSDSKTYFKMGTGGDISFYEDTGTTAKFFWDASAESLGIGTSSPQEKLHVIGSAKLDFGSGGGNPRLYFDHDTVTDDANYIQLNRGDAGLDIISEDNLKFGTNGSEAMRINSSGQVGIGTTSPSANLEISSANPTVQLTDTDDSGYSQIRHNTGSLIFEADKGNTTASSSIRFDIDNTESMRINSSGNLLVGTTSGSDKVTVNGTVNATAFVGDGSGLTGLSAGGLGVGQTPQAKSRSYAGTSYQNTTGKPIFVSAHDGSRNTKLMEVSSNNSTWVTTGGGDSGSRSTRVALVPDGWYYRYGAVSSSNAFWTEVR